MAFFKKRNAARKSLRSKRAQRRHAFRPRLEALEDRQMLATFNLVPGPGFRDAINIANTNNEDDVINLLGAPTVFFFAAPEDGANALPVIQSDNGHSITINGNGAALMRSTGAPGFRYLELATGSTVVINDLTIQDGVASPDNATFGRGGAILNDGHLTLQNVRLLSNDAVLGGAIYNPGTLKVVQSLFDDNIAVGANSLGGAVYNLGEMHVEETTFHQNRTNGLSGGGAIRNEGQLDVFDSVFDTNAAFSAAPGRQGGGAISNRSTAQIRRSTFQNNSAFQGGAITNATSAGPDGLIVADSTFFQNNTFNFSDGLQPAGAGAAISAVTGQLDVHNSTFSNNRARGASGAIIVSSLVTGTLTNSTITENLASPQSVGGGGLSLFAGDAFTLTSNIIAGNGRGVRLDTSAPDDIQGAVSAASSHNLVGVLGAASGIANGVNNNLVGVIANPLDPRLGPLQNNGGPTQTRALLPGSPAIDAGLNPFGAPFDQRGPGFFRRIGPSVDIGAFEFAITNGAPIANPQTVNVSEEGTVAITLTGDDGDPGVSQNLTFAIARPPANGGFVSVQPNGQVVYAPDSQFNGVDTFTFTVTDDSTAGGPARTSAEATVTINVAPINDPPTATPQNVSTNEDIPLAIALSGADGDPEVVQSLTFSIVDSPVHGAISSFNPGTGAAVYSPDPDYNGSDSFTFRVTDDATAGGPALTSSAVTVSITVNAVNDAPVADAGGPYTIDEGQPLALDASGSLDVDAGDVLSYRWDVDGDGDFDENITGIVPTVSWSELIALGVNDGPDSRTITVEVSDGQATTPDAASLTVDNAPPAALINGPGESVPGFERLFTFAATDPSPADESAGFTYSIDWGDGSAPLQLAGPASGITLSHTFAQLGSFVIEATATDKDGGVSTLAQHTVAVQPAGVIEGNVVVGGTSSRDRIIVYGDNAGDVRVRVGAETFGPFTPDANGRLLVFGLEGDDVITVASSVNLPAELHGGEGNDYLAGNGADDMLFGGPGDDRLLGGEGNNLLDGGDGRDYLAGRSGNDILLGGPGDDRLYAGDGDNRADGGAGDDQITAGEGNDLLRGGAGDDTINARGGNDILLGGDDADQLSAGAGRDLLIGGAGVDELFGEDGDDILIGGTTAHDANDAALQAILAEWNSANALQTRIANLTGGVNSLALGSTIFDDGEPDDLFGGSEADWLFELALDQLRDLQQVDRVTR